jgi:hypothetical protein
LLADQIEAILDNGEFPVVLGGDCSLLLGTALALRRRGRYGVLYIDGDADFYRPEVNPVCVAGRPYPALRICSRRMSAWPQCWANSRRVCR